MTTLACPLETDAAWDDPNTVKVVCDLDGNALYFSRSPIPHRDDGEPVDGALHHLGLYAFTRDTVLRFPSLEPTPLEARSGSSSCARSSTGSASACATPTARCSRSTRRRTSRRAHELRGGAR